MDNINANFTSILIDSVLLLNAWNIRKYSIKIQLTKTRFSKKKRIPSCEPLSIVQQFHVLYA